MPKCLHCKQSFKPSFSSFEKYCSRTDCQTAKLSHIPVKKALNQKSEKRRIEEKTYSTLRKVFLETRPNCEAKLEGCTHRSTDVHHKARRGNNYLNVKTFAALCRNCHDYIELNPKWSRDNGWIL